ncbi:MAG: zonular occludens toxin domain-containing protein [Opitutaceae bacterium]|jgi:hypothetical protein
MITCITGKPGDGKTLFAVRELLETLVNSEKFVVTNIPLRLGSVREYVSKRRPDAFDLDGRLKVIPDEEVYEFFRHRSGDLVLPWSPDKDAGENASKRIARPEFIERMKTIFGAIKGDPAHQKPCAYFIDEAHNFFSAREWATNGRGLLYYASQHRHLHDEIFLITQVMENVEKQLRGLVSETHSVRNQLRRRIGPVKMRPVFRVKSFYGVPSGMSSKPFAESTFELDLKGVAGCYNTVGALGIHSKPEEKQNKGLLPWWTLPIGGAVAVVGIVAAFIALPTLGAVAAKKAIADVGPVIVSETKKSGQEAQAMASPQPVAQIAAKAPQSAANQPLAKRTDNPVFETQGIVARGYVMAKGRVNVILSDGTVLTENESELQGVGRNWIMVKGRKIPILPCATVTAHVQTATGVEARAP